MVFRDMNKPLRSLRSVTKVGEEPENKATRNNTRTLECSVETEVMFPGLHQLSVVGEGLISLLT